MGVLCEGAVNDARGTRYAKLRLIIRLALQEQAHAASLVPLSLLPSWPPPDSTARPILAVWLRSVGQAVPENP
jgi:hypothetical protein